MAGFGISTIEPVKFHYQRWNNMRQTGY